MVPRETVDERLEVRGAFDGTGLILMQRVMWCLFDDGVARRVCPGFNATHRLEVAKIWWSAGFRAVVGSVRS